MLRVVLFITLGFSNLLSELVNIETTEIVTKNFLSASNNDFQITGYDKLSYEDKENLAVVYHLKPLGFVVTTMDRNEIPIQAFSFEGNFSETSEDYKILIKTTLYDSSIKRDELSLLEEFYHKTHQENWKYFEEYIHGVSENLEIKESHYVAPPSFSQNFQLQTEEVPTRTMKNIDNLIETNWDQNTYPYALANPNSISKATWINWFENMGYDYIGAEAKYNQYVLNQKYDVIDLFPAGCVSTAWGQLINFYQFPKKSVGHIKYKSYKGKTTSEYLDIDESLELTYNWKSISNNIRRTEQDELNLHMFLRNVGYAVQSNYSQTTDKDIEGTGATNDNAIEGVQKYFGYSTNIKKLEVSNLEVDEFFAKHQGSSWLEGLQKYNHYNFFDNFDIFSELVKNNIDNLQPLIMAYKIKDRDGHAVVVGGYMISGNSLFIKFPTGNGGKLGYFAITKLGDNGNLDKEGNNMLFSDCKDNAESKISVCINKEDNKFNLQALTFVYDIKPCTKEAGDCHEYFIENGGEPKEPFVVSKNWGLYGLTTNSKRISFQQFKDAKTIWRWDGEKQNWMTQEDIQSKKFKPREGFWVRQLKNSNYYFPGSATEDTELTEGYLNSLKNNGWHILGTGQKMKLDKALEKFFPIWIYDRDKQSWKSACELNSDSTIEAGTGMWGYKRSDAVSRKARVCE
jgi:hypothetical protein